MITRKFEQLRFKDNNEKGFVEATFLDHFYFRMDYSELESIGPFNVEKNSISFDANEKKLKKLDFLIDKGISNLYSRITGKRTVYVHSNSGIPLIGNGSFGIVDRGTNIIEIKPFCGCNIDCIYCSVDENKRSMDYMVEKDYLVAELKKVIAIKEKPVEVHIGCQGEPLLYSQLAELIKDISELDNIRTISMDTNMTLLNEKILDGLVDAGLTQLNASLNSTDKEKARRIANKPYNLDHVLKMIRYASKKDIRLIIAPVWMQGVNDDDMIGIIKLSKETGATPGIQNYLSYSFGKKVGKSIPMSEFYDRLKEWEKEYGIRLVMDKSDFGIEEDNELPKEFKKGEITQARIIANGRMSNEYIGVAKDRCISVYDDTRKLDRKIGQEVNVKIVRTKHNIYAGQPA